MSLELVFLVVGVLVGALFGALVAYSLVVRRADAILSRRIGEMQKAETLRTETLLREQQSVLDVKFGSEYHAKFEQWKATELAQTVERERQEAVNRSRLVLKGKVGEQMAPLLPEFASKFDPADARFIGSPVDYIIFEDMSRVMDGFDGSISVVLLDVKSGEKAALSTVQRRIRAAIKEGRMRWETLKVETAGAPPGPAPAAVPAPQERGAGEVPHEPK